MQVIGAQSLSQVNEKHTDNNLAFSLLYIGNAILLKSCSFRKHTPIPIMYFWSYILVIVIVLKKLHIFKVLLNVFLPKISNSICFWFIF